jgi:hypothetical protein
MTDICFSSQSTQETQQINTLRIEIGLFSNFIDTLTHIKKQIPITSLRSQHMDQSNTPTKSIFRQVVLKNFDKLKKLQLILFKKFKDKADDLGVFSPLENFNQPLQLIALFRKLSTQDLDFLLSVFYQDFATVLKNNAFFKKFSLSDQAKKFVMQEILVYLITDNIEGLLDKDPFSVDPGVDFFSISKNDPDFTDLKNNFIYQSKLFSVEISTYVERIMRTGDVSASVMELYASWVPGYDLNGFLAKADLLYALMHVDMGVMIHPLSSSLPLSTCSADMFISNEMNSLQNLYQSIITRELAYEIHRTKFAIKDMLKSLSKEVLSLKNIHASTPEKFYNFLVNTLNNKRQNILENFLSFNYSNKQKMKQISSNKNLTINSTENTDLSHLREMLLQGTPESILKQTTLSLIPFKLKRDFLLWHFHKCEARFLKPKEMLYTKQRPRLCNLKRANIFKVKESKIGKERPQEVLGECSFSNVNMEEAIQEDWDAVKENDRMFLMEIGFQTHMEANMGLLKHGNQDILGRSFYFFLFFLRDT